jgi:hypothetical protein
MTHDDVIDRLIQAALDILHHDTDHGDAVDLYERKVLRERFAAILHPPTSKPERKWTGSGHLEETGSTKYEP